MKIEKNEKAEKLVADLHDKTDYFKHEKFTTSIESWINFERGSKCFAKAIYWYEHRSKKNNKK